MIPAHDQHVVGAAGDLLHAHQCPPAGASLPAKRGDVAGAVADDGQRLLGESVNTSSPLVPSGSRLARDGVDHLGEEMVLEDVQALLVRALLRHAGADDLAEAVDVESHHPEPSPRSPPASGTTTAPRRRSPTLRLALRADRRPARPPVSARNEAIRRRAAEPWRRNPASA